MTVNTTWTDPSTGGAIDLATGQVLTEVIYDKILSNLKNIGGTTVLRVGVNSQYTTVAAALAAAVNGSTIQVDAGTYPGFTVYPKQFIQIEGSGQPEYDSATGTLIGGTIFTGKTDFFDSVGSSLSNCGVDTHTIDSDCVDTGSATSGGARLNQRFHHLTISANPNDGAACHCFRSQGGWYLELDDIRTYGGSHGIAIRGSHVNVSNCYIENGQTSALTVKAVPSTGNAQFVNISNIESNNPAANGAGTIVVQAYDGAICSNVNISNVNSYNTLAQALIIQAQQTTVVGIVNHINVSNFTSVDCLAYFAAIKCMDASYVSFTNCRVINNRAAYPAIEALVTTGVVDNVTAFNFQKYPESRTMVGLTHKATDAGVYTPTLYNTTNVTASTAFECRWMRVGDMVTVSGSVSINPTSAADTLLGMSLPVASNFTTALQLAGTAGSHVIKESAALYSDATNDRASFRWLATTVGNWAWRFVFMYQVL
jgi:hypothetical protein